MASTLAGILLNVVTYHLSGLCFFVSTFDIMRYLATNQAVGERDLRRGYIRVVNPTSNLELHT